MKWLTGIATVLVIGAAAYWAIYRVILPDGDNVSVVATFVSGAMEEPFRRFQRDLGRFPTSQEGFEALIEAPLGTESKWNGPYIVRVPTDPWGNGYRYRCPGLMNPEGYDLWSLGPDGVESKDDTVNWEK